jgi:hypothetical protein
MSIKDESYFEKSIFFLHFFSWDERDLRSIVLELGSALAESFI